MPYFHGLTRASLPRQSPIPSRLLATTRRPLSSSPAWRLKEDSPQSPEKIEAAKQEQLRTGKGKEELESSSEAAVGADQAAGKVKDHGKHMEELQKQTAGQKQAEHPEGKS